MTIRNQEILVVKNKIQVVLFSMNYSIGVTIKQIKIELSYSALVQTFPTHKVHNLKFQKHTKYI